GGEGGLAARGFGDMPRERRLADAGVAEQAEHLRLAGLQPAANLVDRLSLVARPFAPDRLRARRFRRDGGRGGRRSASRSAACGRDHSIWRRRPDIGAWFRGGPPRACSWPIVVPSGPAKSSNQRLIHNLGAAFYQN